MSFYLLYEQICKSLIKEGGNAVPGVDRIKQQYINDTIAKFKEEIVDKFLGTDSSDVLFLIGSTRKETRFG